MKKSLLGTCPTSISGLDYIRWCAKSLLGTCLHPFPVSTISDGMKKACLAQTIHPIKPSAITDGAPAQKRSNSLHPSTLSTNSDGAPFRNVQIHYIHLCFRPYPMEHLLRNTQKRYIHLRTRPNPMEPPHFTIKNFRPQVLRSRKQDFLPSVTNQFTISDQFRSFPKLLSSRLVP